jgi:aminoglycoside phosphotransferase (APT) family kinase protein
MMPGAKDLLDVVMLNLQRYVAPQVTSDDGRMTLLLVTYVLGFLYVEEHDRPALHAARYAAMEPLLRELKTRFASPATEGSVRAAGGTAPVAVGTAPVAVGTAPAAVGTAPAAGKSASDVGEARIAIDQALREPASADATSRALQLALRCGADTDSAWTRRVAEAELDYVERLADAVNGWAYGTTVQSIAETGQRQLTADLVTAYLKTTQTDFSAITATRVVEIGGGFSKKTYQLNIADGPAGWDRLIIRQDAIGGPVPSSCLDEVDVLRVAERHGLPLGTLMWVEKSSEPLGAPFIFSRRADGVCALDAWKQRGPDGKLPGEHLAAYMARLHAIPLSQLPGVKPSMPQAVLRAYVEAFETRWQRDRAIFDPLIQLGFDWLKRHVPTNVERLSIVHADISERNVLVHDGVVTAILDWELWHVGDPMYDLAYIKPFIEHSMPWRQFSELYQAAGGAAVSMANEDYWYIFSKIRDSAMLSSSLRTFVDGRNRNLKTIAPVLGWYRPQLRLAMRRLLPLL